MTGCSKKIIVWTLIGHKLRNEMRETERKKTRALQFIWFSSAMSGPSSGTLAGGTFGHRVIAQAIVHELGIDQIVGKLINARI